MAKYGKKKKRMIKTQTSSVITNKKEERAGVQSVTYKMNVAETRGVTVFK